MAVVEEKSGEIAVYRGQHHSLHHHIEGINAAILF